MDCSMPGFLVLPYLLKFTQTHVHQWCHPTISSSIAPFSCLQYFPASWSFLMSQLFASGGQSVGASASEELKSFWRLRNNQQHRNHGVTATARPETYQRGKRLWAHTLPCFICCRFKLGEMRPCYWLNWGVLWGPSAPHTAQLPISRQKAGEERRSLPRCPRTWVGMGIHSSIQ